MQAKKWPSARWHPLHIAVKPGGGPQSEKAQEVVPGELGSPAAQGLPGTRPPADFRPLWGSISSYVKRRNVTTDL